MDAQCGLVRCYSYIVELARWIILYDDLCLCIVEGTQRWDNVDTTLYKHYVSAAMVHIMIYRVWLSSLGEWDESTEWLLQTKFFMHFQLILIHRDRNFTCAESTAILNNFGKLYPLVDLTENSDDVMRQPQQLFIDTKYVLSVLVPLSNRRCVPPISSYTGISSFLSSLSVIQLDIFVKS